MRAALITGGVLFVGGWIVAALRNFIDELDNVGWDKKKGGFDD